MTDTQDIPVIGPEDTALLKLVPHDGYVSVLSSRDMAETGFTYVYLDRKGLIKLAASALALAAKLNGKADTE